MTDAGIPMGEGQDVCPACGALPCDWTSNPFAATPTALPMPDDIARVIDPDAWHETLPTDGCGAYWIGRRNKARSKADAILALRTPEPNSGGEASQ